MIDPNDPDAQTLHLSGRAVRLMVGVCVAGTVIGTAAYLLPEVFTLHPPYDLLLSLALGGGWAILGGRRADGVGLASDHSGPPAEKRE